MSRGQNKLFKEFIDVKPSPAPRDIKLDRNIALVHRYYYHVQLLEKRYDKTLNDLTREFWLSEARITDILQRESYQDMQRVFTAKPTVKEMRETYPWFSW